MSEDVKLEKFLADHKDEWEQLESGKIKCKLTNHELPRRLDALEVRCYSASVQHSCLLVGIQAHQSGRVYRRVKKDQERNPVNLPAWIVPHSTDKRKVHKIAEPLQIILENLQVYCKLTKHVLNFDQAEISKHIEGK